MHKRFFALLRMACIVDVPEVLTAGRINAFPTLRYVWRMDLRFLFLCSTEVVVLSINSIKLLIRFLPVHSIVIFTLVGLLLYHVVKNQRIKALSLMLWGFVFACLYGHPAFAILTFLLTFLVYLLAKSFVKMRSGFVKKALLFLGIVFYIGMLFLFKYPVLKARLPLMLQVKALGISYFTFKFLHVLIDTYRGRIKELDFCDFAAFIFFFPTFSAGPIDRYPRFKRDFDEVRWKDVKTGHGAEAGRDATAGHGADARRGATAGHGATAGRGATAGHGVDVRCGAKMGQDFDDTEVKARGNLSNFANDNWKANIDIGVTRIIFGLFKKFIIADKTGVLISKIAPDVLAVPRMILWVVVFLYSVRIYYDFSGYSDIAIGLGRLFGFKVPENFNKPYLKPNIVLFWQNWHMTLTSWLREYLFMPLGKMLMGFLGAGHTWVINGACQLVTMAVVGIWHGSTVGFLIWGLYHGVGLSLYRIYADLLKKYGSQSFMDMLNGSKIARYGSVFLTFVFVSTGWVFFSFRWETAVKVLGKLIGLL